LSVFRRNSAAEDYLTRLRVAGIRRSPFLDLISAGLSGAATGSAGGFFGNAEAIQAPASLHATSGATLPGLFNQPANRRPIIGSIFGTPLRQ